MDLDTFVKSSIVATVISVVLTQNLAWQKQKRASRAQLHGILLETKHAEACAKAYLESSSDKPWAPGYRIVTDFLRAGIGVLSEAGSLRRGEVEALHSLYIAIDEANRSLELLATHASTLELSIDRLVYSPLLTFETSRARMKFGHVIERIPAARAAAIDSLERMAWFEPQD